MAIIASIARLLQMAPLSRLEASTPVRQDRVKRNKKGRVACDNGPVACSRLNASKANGWLQKKTSRFRKTRRLG